MHIAEALVLDTKLYKCCGQSYARKNICPARDHRCSTCAQLGHNDEFCPNIALKDATVKLRTLIKPWPGGTHISHKLDRTAEQRLASVEAVVQRLLDIVKSRSEAAKRRRIRTNAKGKKTEDVVMDKATEEPSYNPLF
eukprot:Lankesteria_metandrocarpae@DN4182_c0_g1_i1.p1